jgi:hypothetical protein
MRELASSNFSIGLRVFVPNRLTVSPPLLPEGLQLVKSSFWLGLPSGYCIPTALTALSLKALVPIRSLLTCQQIHINRKHPVFEFSLSITLSLFLFAVVAEAPTCPSLLIRTVLVVLLSFCR